MLTVSNFQGLVFCDSFLFSLFLVGLLSSDKFFNKYQEVRDEKDI